MTRSRRRRCPACGELSAIPVVYGLPGPELLQQFHEGKVMLGGCVVSTEGDPQWHCTSCNKEWLSLEEKKRAPRRKSGEHQWEFTARFRKQAFGWKEGPAVQRVKQAVAEIVKVARKDPVVGAEGAVRFLERVSPAIEQVDGSSGSIGTAVNRAVETLAGIIAKAPLEFRLREELLERLYHAHEEDQMPYIEALGEYWGEMCASRELANLWADRLIEITRLSLSPDKAVRGHFHGAVMCLSALHAAERYGELMEIAGKEGLWHYRSWAARALAAQGRVDDALEFAEAGRNPWSSDFAVDQFCEETLLAAGRDDDAYERYGLSANRGNTYLTWFRNVQRKYPNKSAAEILADLVEHTPGEEGKWFAAAKDAGLYDEAIQLVSRTPCSPQTLARAARDFVKSQPAFAIEAGVASLRWIAAGYGYEITGTDVRMAFSNAMEAAATAGCLEATRVRIRELAATASDGGRFLKGIVGRECN